MTKRGQAAGNQGIVATTVNADVLAVGRNAQAHKTVLGNRDQQQLLNAVDTLRKELNNLKLTTAERNELEEHAKQISEVATKHGDAEQAKSSLTRFTQKLTQLGVAVNEVAGLVTPIRTIAGLLHIGLASLGLSL